MIALLQLLWSFIQVGVCSIGGGMAAMPLIQHQVVELHSWLTVTEFTDLITIAEMTPGPIAINSATFVGIRIAGIPGALVATLGCVLPSAIIVSTLAFVYRKYKNLSVMQGVLSGLRPAIVALIASAGITIFSTAIWNSGTISFSMDSINFVSLGLFAVALIILRMKKPSPILVMVGCGVVGGIIYLLFPSLLL